MILASIERMKPGTIFRDSRGELIKLQDVLPSGYPEALRRVNPVTGQNYGDFIVNAIYLKDGSAACCPYNMEIFGVDSLDDLRTDEEMEKLNVHTVRHIGEVATCIHLGCDEPTDGIKSFCHFHRN